MAVSILPSATKAPLELFCQLPEPNWWKWSWEKDDMLGLAYNLCHVT